MRRDQLRRSNGITRKAQIGNLGPSLGRGRSSVVDLTWEVAGKLCQLSHHPVGNEALEDIGLSLASGVDDIPVLIDPTGIGGLPF